LKWSFSELIESCKDFGSKKDPLKYEQHRQRFAYILENFTLKYWLHIPSRICAVPPYLSQITPIYLFSQLVWHNCLKKMDCENLLNDFVIVYLISSITAPFYPYFHIVVHPVYFPQFSLFKDFNLHLKKKLEIINDIQATSDTFWSRHLVKLLNICDYKVENEAFNSCHFSYDYRELVAIETLDFQEVIVMFFYVKRVVVMKHPDCPYHWNCYIACLVCCYIIYSYWLI